MTWRPDDPQGNESGKVRFELVPYMRGRVLDLGCGPHKVYPIAIGIDNSIDAKLFGIKCKPDIAVDTCERLPFLTDACADTVYSSHLLEHIEDTEATLREWWRLVNVGGHLILYLPHRDHYPRIGQPGGNLDHKHDFAPQDIVDVMVTVAGQSGQGWTLVRNETRTEAMEYSFLQIYRKRDVAHCGDESVIKLQPKKTLGIVRLGAYGDALWLSTVLPHFKEQGYHITLYTQPQGEEMLRHDPNIDHIICQPHGLFDFGDGSISMWQHAYWEHESKKYTRFLNAVGAVERRLLPQVMESDFYLPDEQRRNLMNKNYVEALHEMLGVPFDPATVRQRFYPTEQELAEALAYRAKLKGPLVLINPSGSSVPKWWPYAQELADMLAAERIHSRIVGDLRLNKFRASGSYGIPIGTTWSMRKALALALVADIVIGTESALVNAVAHTSVLKIVLLSHSTFENLTRDWTNTIAYAPENLPCYPCHRIHATMQFCTHDTVANAAACQSAAKAADVLELIKRYFPQKAEAVA